MLFLNEAKEVAAALMEDFGSRCERIKVAGSTRRQSPHVGDIELVAIPIYNYQGTLFGGKIIVGNELYPVVDRIATKVNKQGAKYTQFTLDGLYHDFLLKQVKVDLFLSTEQNNGLNFLIRTGSAVFTRSVLGYANKLGYHSEGSILRDADGKSFPMKEEKQVFEFLGLPYIEPILRENALDNRITKDL